MSDREKSELWRRWKDGQSLSDISRALEKNPGSVHGVLESKGGIAPRLPLQRFKRAPQSPTASTEFETARSNRKWATDISYVKTWEGWVYLAVVIDLFSRRVVGWSIRDHLRTELVSEALVMAIGRRVPGPGLLHHSDQGSQYGSDDYRRLLSAQGITCSTSRRGNCWDNAVVESFFATLKREFIYRRSWPTRDEAIASLDEWVDFYNRERRHSFLGFRSPEEYEQTYVVRKRASAA